MIKLLRDKKFQGLEGRKKLLKTLAHILFYFLSSPLSPSLFHTRAPVYKIASPIFFSK